MNIEVKHKIPEPIERVLAEHQARVYEAIAVLEMASDYMATEGMIETDEGGRICRAVDVAIRLLQPVTDVGDTVALRQAAEL